MNGFEKKAILFDKDGTLIEFNTIWLHATQAMIPLFTKTFKVKDDVVDREILEGLGISKEKVEDSTAIASGTSWDVAQVLQQFLEKDDPNVLHFVREYFYEYTKKNHADLKEIGDVQKLFMRLKEAGYVIGIVTADDYETTMYTIKHLKLVDMVDFIATGDRYEPKPSMAALESFSKEFQIPTSNILFIGDSIVDMQFGEHCQKGIGVLSGVGDEQALMRYTDVIYPTIHEIPYAKYLEEKI